MHNVKTVLIVDDRNVQLKTLRRALRTRGFLVLEARSGRQALEHLEHIKNIDIVLTDYAMPEMNGIELLRKIRKIYKSLPVILMTAYGDKDLVVEAMHYDCNGFIDKPFNIDELLDIFNKYDS